MLNFVKTVEKAVGKVVEWWWKESGKSCEKEGRKGDFEGMVGESWRNAQSFRKIYEKFSTREFKIKMGGFPRFPHSLLLLLLNIL